MFLVISNDMRSLYCVSCKVIGRPLDENWKEGGSIYFVSVDDNIKLILSELGS